VAVPADYSAIFTGAALEFDEPTLARRGSVHGRDHGENLI
jgi:hypothetical protein